MDVETSAQEAEPTCPEWNCLLVGIAEFLGQESCLLFWYFPHSIGGFKFCLKLKQRLQTQLFIWSFLSLWCHPVDLHISVSGRAAPRYRFPGQEWLWLPESPRSPAMIPATLSGRQVPEGSDHLSRRSKLLLLVTDGASCTRWREKLSHSILEPEWPWQAIEGSDFLMSVIGESSCVMMSVIEAAWGKQLTERPPWLRVVEGGPLLIGSWPPGSRAEVAAYVAATSVSAQPVPSHPFSSQFLSVLPLTPAH